MFGRREAWRDLEPTERAAIVLGGVVQIALQGRRVARSSPPGGRGAQRLKTGLGIGVVRQLPRPDRLLPRRAPPHDQRRRGIFAVTSSRSRRASLSPGGGRTQLAQPERGGRS